jgi:V/A-type H+-transporting ATPase subunit E
MATISISGTNKLAERIVGEAEADAKKVLSEAEAGVRSIREESDKALGELRKSLAAKREAATKSLLDGFVTRTALDGRKSALAKKRAVIDKAFSQAYCAVLALDEDARTQICAKLLLVEAEGGETVVPAKADRKGIQKTIGDMKDVSLKLSERNADIEGGFLLVSGSYEKDCSFASLMNEIRGGEETHIAKMLFD